MMNENFNKLINTGVKWLPEINSKWKIGRVKDLFYISKELSAKNNPIILSLARSAVKVRDISNNEGQLAASYDNYNSVQVGDLLLNPMDLYSGANCNVSYVDGVISPAYSNLRAKIQLEPKYYDYYFKTQYWTMAMFAHGKGVSFDNRWTLNNDVLLNYEVPIVPFNEQQKIVDILNKKVSQIDALILNQENQIEKLKEYKQSLITDIVTKGTNKSVAKKNSKIDWIGDIPVHWSITKIKYIGNTQNGISKSSEYFGHGYPFITYADVYKNYSLPLMPTNLIESNEKEREIFSVKKGDIFFTRTSETIEEVGFSSVCEETINNSCFAGFLIRLRPFNMNSKIITLFAKYYFRSNLTRRFLVKEMNLVTRASLGQDLLKSMYVLLPPLDEQVEIANYLDEKCSKIDKLIEVKQSKIEKLQEYKKSIIYEYVTGKKLVD